MDASMSEGRQTTHSPIVGNATGPKLDAVSPERANVEDLLADNAHLREQLALRDLALDGIQSTFVISDRTTVEPTILYCNRMAADMFGLQRDQVIGMGLGVMSQYNVTSKRDFRKDHAVLSTGQSLAYEFEVSRADGSTFWRGVTVVPIFGSDGSLVRSIAMGADITAKREAARRSQELQDQLVVELKERERMVGELHLAQKLESVGRLASGIAHEINTPIQYIGDCIHFLRSAYGDLDQILEGWQTALAGIRGTPQIGDLRLRVDEIVVKYELAFLRAEIPKAFERMSDGVARVTNIVSAMKEFAHPDANEQSAADINHAIRSTLIVATNVYKFVASVHTDFAELPDVVCNIGQLNQVFLNLVVNASHAIEDAARPTGTGEIKIVTSQSDDRVVIRISDNGCGIPTENLSKLFDPFFTTKEVGRGTGQGLAIAHSIVVDKHGGELSVKSVPGEGTEFTLWLPIDGVRGIHA
jgi:PAS domain S-box-containing protein